MRASDDRAAGARRTTSIRDAFDSYGVMINETRKDARDVALYRHPDALFSLCSGCSSVMLRWRERGASGECHYARIYYH